MPEAEVIRKFRSPEDAKQATGTFAKITWRSDRFRAPLVLLFEGVIGPKAGERYFLTARLAATDEKIELPLEYPHIPLSEKEATVQINHLRQLAVGAVGTKPIPIIGGSSLLRSTQPEPLTKESSMSDEKEAKKEEAPPKEPTIYGTLVAALREGKEKAEAVAAAMKAFKDADEKKVKQMVHSIAAQLKNKTGKAKKVKAIKE